MRGVQKCTCAGASLRGRNSAPLCCIKLDTATDPVYGSEFESIWLEMIGTKWAVYPEWTFYALDVELNDNQRHMILIGKSPENKWKVVNFGK